MAYRLSERATQERMRKRRIAAQRTTDKKGVDLGAVASVFILFGILGLLTSWFYSLESGKAIRSVIKPAELLARHEPEPEFGPIRIERAHVPYQIDIIAKGIPNQSWTFVQGILLDAQGNYVFSFGDEFWHESGYDDGPWEEARTSYTMDLSFPQPGTYYLRLEFESKNGARTMPSRIYVRIARKFGSHIPHFWFGLISLLIGIVLNEIKNHSIKRFLDMMDGKS